ncbi:hypothetical protein RN001_010188 [Aquatica leii]|uniref:Uncharacterized protein n=1 Tax=Aquatica leii TaxID=1421715 RepID=A0AAN7SEA9_9COLE|nr:hypothetical protein RN001_010188 [Aquatica leii]
MRKSENRANNVEKSMEFDEFEVNPVNLVTQEKLWKILVEIWEQNKQILARLQSETPTGSQVALDIPVQFPISTIKDINLLETHLLERQNVIALSDYLSTLGGRDIPTKTNRILKTTLSNILASEFSFFGSRSEKRAFGGNKTIDSERSGVRGDEVYVPRLWYIDILNFIRDQEILRKTQTNVEDENESCNLITFWIEDINENVPPTLEDTPSTSQWKNYTPSEMQRSPHNALSTSRRRPITVVKALTSSNVAEKYNQLLDKRLSIADLTENEMKQKKEFKEQSRAIKLQLLQIELEIKQKQLKNLEKNNYL